MSHLTKLNEHEIRQLTEQHPNLPPDYLEYLQTMGWGESEAGRMVYAAPMVPNEVFAEPDLDEIFQEEDIAVEDIVLLGDDFQGYCLGYHLILKQYGELSVLEGWEFFEPGYTIFDYGMDTKVSERE